MSFLGNSDDIDSGGGDGARPPNPNTPQGALGDGQPGYPIHGYSGWRAGVFSAPNLLGVVNTDGSASSADGGGAFHFGQRIPSLIKVADQTRSAPSGVLDYERNSWRWSDPDALAYDLQRKQEQLAEAQAIANGLHGSAWGQIGAGILGKALKGVIRGDSLPLSIGSLAGEEYMNHAEIPMLQKEIDALRDRLTLLQRQPSN